MNIKIIFIFLLFASTNVFAEDTVGKPYIAVHGTASEQVVPDVFPLRITLSEVTKDTASTQATIEGLSKELVRIASEKNVPNTDIKVGALRISPEFDYDSKTETNVFKGNLYEKQVSIRFKSIVALKEYMSKIPASRLMRLQTGSFEYSKASEVRKRLIDAAAKDARESADAMAAAVGKKIIGVYTVSNAGANINYANSINVASNNTFARSEAIGSVDLSEGTLDINADIYIVYLIDG